MTVENSGPELVIALVTPAGVRRDALQKALNSALSAVGYRTTTIRLSKLLERTSAWSAGSTTSEVERISRLQEIGNSFREKLADGAALVRSSIAAIREERFNASGDPEKPITRMAYILDQLKHPTEVELLREIYGSCCLVISAHAPEDSRVQNLAREMADKANEAGASSKYTSGAFNVITADEKQEGDYGQNTRDTYPKADFFIDLGTVGGEYAIERFFELIFAHPFHTPSRAEYAMYQASAASRRSSDDSRQVGAAIATDDSDVVAVGANEVPIAGGGLHWWPGSPDSRDQALARNGDDRAANLKRRVLVQLLGRLADKGLLAPGLDANSISQRTNEILDILKGTDFMNLGEFGRPVHAEMAALIDAARRGVGVNKLTMYVTTFPCHNCAKHIIASGIKKVVYLEPYPKSQAGFLHAEEMVLDPVSENYAPRVGFVPYTGVAPRQYHQLFAMTLRGKKGLSISEWNSKKTTLLPRYVPRNASQAYLTAERQELEKLPEADFKWDKKKLCPI